MDFGDDRHSNFLRKNAALSKAYEFSKKDNKDRKEDQTPQECFVCKSKENVKKFKVSLNERSSGVASFSYEFRFFCKEHAPKGKASVDAGVDPKKIKSMLKSARKGLR